MYGNRKELSNQICTMFSLHCRPLSQFIRSIVRVISHKLNDDTFSDIDEGLIGLDSRVLELES